MREPQDLAVSLSDPRLSSGRRWLPIWIVICIFSTSPLSLSKSSRIALVPKRDTLLRVIAVTISGQWLIRRSLWKTPTPTTNPFTSQNTEEAPD